MLAVGAHPDDVEIGVGGTLAAHHAAGDSIVILTLSGGAIGGIIAAVLVGGGLAFWLSKRGKNSQDRE